MCSYANFRASFLVQFLYMPNASVSVCTARGLQTPLEANSVDWIWIVLGSWVLQGFCVKEPFTIFLFSAGTCAGEGKVMQTLVSSKTL